MSALILLGPLAVSLTALNTEKNVPEPGQPAPPLNVEQWIQPVEPPVRGWEELRGKAVVLEFWSTWCGPCVSAMPHLNELAQKFRDRVEFISVSDEGEAAVKKFLRLRPIEGWVLLDRDRSMFRDYGVEGIPYTVLLDGNSDIVGISQPQHITEAVLNDVLAGKSAEVRATLPKPVSFSDSEVRLREESSFPAVFAVVIRPAKPEASAVSWSKNRLILRAMTLRMAIRNAYEVSPGRLVMPEELAETTYDFLVTVPPEPAGLLDRVLQQALETAFGFRVRRETREANVFVLVAPHGRTPGLQEPVSGGSFSRSHKGMIEGRGMPLRNLAESLENVLKRPVVEETGIKGTFDFDLHWEPEKPDSLFRVLREQLGLELRDAQRCIEFLIVEK